MQDRYLFRGKRYDNKEWIEGCYCQTPAFSYIYRYPDDELVRSFQSMFYEIDPATVGQCTGLKDKNGKLIFEGDIARTSKGLILTVHYNKAQYELGNKEKDGYFVLSIYKPEELEVIGNIHDRTEGEA